jgi:hypothetical protein
MISQPRHAPILVELLTTFGWGDTVRDLCDRRLLPCGKALRWLCGLPSKDGVRDRALRTMLILSNPADADGLPDLAAACSPHPALGLSDIYTLATRHSPAHLLEVIQHCAAVNPNFLLADVSHMVSLTHPGRVQTEWAAHLRTLALQAQLAADQQALNTAVDLLGCSADAKTVLKKAIAQFSLAGGTDLSVESNTRPEVIAEATAQWQGLLRTVGLQLVSALWVPGGPGEPDRKDRGTHWEYTKNLMATVNGVQHNIHVHPSNWRVRK